MNKWYKPGAALVLASVLTLTGCSGSDNAGNSPGSSPASSSSSPAPSGTPADSSATSQDTLITARGGDSAALDASIVTDGESLKVTQQIFEGLLDYKPGTTEIQPKLAESYEVSPDGLTYTFKLRQGVKFSDGTDFNADAVVFNFTRWSDPKSEFKFEGDSFDYYDSMFGPDGSRVIKEVTAVDPGTVKFVLNQPQAPFLQNIAMPPFGIGSPTAIKEKKDKFKSEPVGTGPFVFKEWKRNDSITVEKNPTYWQQGLPKLNKVVFKVIPDNSARFTALQNGEIDLMEGVNPDDLKTLEGNADLQKIVRASFNIGYLGFNIKKKPFDNPKVRVALNYAVNKEAIIQAFYGGLAEPAVNPMPPSTLGYNKDVQDYPYDLEKAKQLLAEAGYPSGLPEEMTFYAMPVARPYMPDGKKVAEAIQADFAKIGVKTKIESPEWATYLDDVKKGEKDDLFMLGWTGDNGDPDNFLFTLLHKDAIGSNNYSFYSNDEVNKLLSEGQSETDSAKREELYKQAQVLIKQDAPWIPLVHSTPLLAGSAKLAGYTPSPTGSEPYTEIYFK
ncbi:peptide ABC transporter substrate-binding protein [Paenibacillus sp. D9]|uniref:ABC transporter substrate-binding protein n=1 Tax=Paenibacillus humicus TaxID=412861 RepID=UPI000416137D|nr:MULTISPECIES: ABC transporter substrate-binding protein [Paenibacillus]KKC49140.1 peptide ABC transporter substrate-binding protein [Paenibacillus sp. D9]CDN42379.1 Heme-binding protein A [Paenibacillus sp. P22]